MSNWAPNAFHSYYQVCLDLQISSLGKEKRVPEHYTTTNSTQAAQLQLMKFFTFGFDIQRRPRANGTARRMFCSPYCKRCSNDRIAISRPNSSAIATIAIPSTAGPWWASPFSWCCAQWPKRFWTCKGKNQLLICNRYLKNQLNCLY